MFSKEIVAAGVVALGLAAMPADASAKTNVDINIGVGRGGNWCYYHPGACGYGHGYDYDYGYGYGFYRHPRPYLYRYYEPEPYRISCGEAKGIVRDHGFYKVRTESCGKRVDTFIGWKNGKRWLIEVGTRNGNIRVQRW